MINSLVVDPFRKILEAFLNLFHDEEFFFAKLHFFKFFFCALKFN